MNLSKGRKREALTLIGVLTIIVTVGCSDSVSTAETATKPVNQVVNVAKTEESNAALRQVDNPGRMPSQNGGLVKMVQAAGAYTYLQVDVGGEMFWLATMATAVQPGQKIGWRDYVPMKNFTSKALGREFDKILFVDRIYAEQGATETLQRGIVAETLNAAGYSFVRVDRNGDYIWLAAPEVKLDVGQQISWSGGAPMRNFTSRSLDRTFDEIFFVGALHRS